MTEHSATELEETVIEPPTGWMHLRLREAWEFRELLFFLVWRDIKVRYKQTVLGATWAILQPVITMVIFSVIFGRLARLPSNGIPYPIFAYAALLPWQLFSRALSDASGSLVNNEQFVTKIYFPRLFLPAASILSGLLDFLIALSVIFALLAYYRIPVTPRIFALVPLILLALTTSLAAAMWLSAINVKYRDVKHALPFLMQAWLYATPVAYSTILIPEQWRALYGLNPMVGVVEGFRWALLGTEMAPGPLFGVSMITVGLLFTGGLFYFQRMERGFSDII